jgi:biotin synthase-like enzyme
MSTRLNCKYCRQNCYASLPAETPQAIRNSFEQHQRECEECRLIQQYGIVAATCREGQTNDRFHIGYSWRDITQALALLKLMQAVQIFIDLHGADCHCQACTFAVAAMWNASEKGHELVSQPTM